MQQFMKPSSDRKPSFWGSVGVAVGLAVGISGLQFVVTWIDQKAQTNAGQYALGGVIIATVWLYWEATQKKLDEIGQQLSLESAAFAMRGMIAGAIAIAFLWGIPAVRTVIGSFGFPLFFGTAGALQALGYLRAKQRLS